MQDIALENIFHRFDIDIYLPQYPDEQGGWQDTSLETYRLTGPTPNNPNKYRIQLMKNRNGKENMRLEY